MILPIKYIKTSKLIKFRDSKEFDSTGYLSDLQRFVQDEIFYRNYLGVHGIKVAKREYSKHSKLRGKVWLSA